MLANTARMKPAFYPRTVPRLVVYLLITWVGALSACNNAPDRTCEAQLEEKNRHIAQLDSRADELQQTVARLQSELLQAQADLENIRIKEAELRAWSQQLAERFGPSIWFFGEDERPLPQQRIEHATPSTLIRELNRRLLQLELPTLQLIKIENDTAFLRISDETKLTQGMGTTGATAYLEAVTYTLTSLKPIRWVHFDLKEGDHAMPGTYSR